MEKLCRADPALVRVSCCVEETARHCGSKKVSFMVSGAGAPWDEDTSEHSAGVSSCEASGPRRGSSPQAPRRNPAARAMDNARRTDGWYPTIGPGIVESLARTGHGGLAET